MRIRHVEKRDYPARVDLHRAAWFRSSFDLRRYLRVRAIDVFEPELDLIVETAEGRLASFCIGWVDRRLGVGSFEPVGTHPDFRRLGLGQQVTYEGLRRMKAMGMHSAKIGTAGFNERAFALYCSCGFELRDRERTWVKAII
jgi:ribosomal protein S18 acetylase RimI-like enzyme